MRTMSLPSRLPLRALVVGVAITASFGGGAGVTAREHDAATASHDRGFSMADRAQTSDLGANTEVRARYGKLPLSFEANHGQTDSTVRFLSRGIGYTLFLTTTEAVLVLGRSESAESHNASRLARTAARARPCQSAVVRMTLVNANSQVRAAGHDELPGRSHYFIGRDPAKWRTNIHTYARVRYEGVYPGVDLVYYGNQGQLEYDFVVAPGADPRVVTLAFEGTREVRIDARGELVLGIEGGELRQHKPVVYQEAAGVKQEVAAHYVMKEKGHVGFRMAAYDPSRPLIIDPVLVYSTYLHGGISSESGQGIAVDDAGNAYVTGETVGMGFPTTAGAFQTTLGNPEGSIDAFVTKLNAAGSALVYSTYLGGSDDDRGNDIVVDSTGSAYVTGSTEFPDFPTTPGAAQTTFAGDTDAFVTKLNATGSGLVYSTFLGGGGTDIGMGIAVDLAGSAYVSGYTIPTSFPSASFPTTAGAAQPTNGGEFDAFVTKLNAAGSALVYSTFLGGSESDIGHDIAVDAAGNACVTGYMDSTNFPTTAGAPQTTYGGGVNDAFATKLNASGSSLVYSTYLGGNDSDLGYGIAVDAAASCYVTGYTVSTNFPTTAGAAQPIHGGGIFDAFVTKLNTTGTELVYSTYLGGSGSSGDTGFDIAVDTAGSAYVTGYTHSTDFPTTAGATQSTHGGGDFDAYVAKLHPSGSRLVFSTYLGGGDMDFGFAIAVDATGSVYVTGQTRSPDFPTTAGAFQTTQAGREFDDDAFVTRIATLPTSVDECKNGGWESFGVFRNQGDCVSFVRTHGTNPPSGR